MKVYLSPSTQENNIGTGGYGTEEKRMNQVADVVERLLKNSGITVIRNKPTMTLKQVVEDSNKNKPDIHFAIHSNAGGGTGCEVYAWLVPDSKGGYKGTPGYRLAKAVYNEVSKITPMVDRGVKQGVHLYEIKNTVAPAALIEIAFHDNPTDANWIINNIDNIGKAIARGICNYFGVPLKEPAPPKKPISNGKLYKVQVGAFKNRDNAEALLAKLKKAGFDGFIKFE
jgi:N-acetylmuramoyl-L-alanine amidase